MIPNRALRLAAIAFCMPALGACDLLPLGGRAPEQAVADTGTVVQESGATPASAPARRSAPSRRARTVPQPDATAAPADTPQPAPPPPTPVQRARGAMISDLERLESAQAEHLANQGRYSSQLARLGLRYIPHAGVRVQIASGDAAGWAAVATHADVPGERCVIWVGQAPADLAAIAPAPGRPACAGP